MATQKLSLDINTLLDTFDIKITKDCVPLDNWLNATGKLTNDQDRLLKAVQEQFLKQGDEWNEEELKIKFLSFLFFIADIEEAYKIQTFFERMLSANINNITLTVKCDCMVATPKGKGAPKLPYFFLQEFKKQKGDNHDPEGQMFAAMLISRELNQDEKPVYGAWLVGNQWRFTVLYNNSYSYSRYYDATDSEDLSRIVFIIRKLKDLILNR